MMLQKEYDLFKRFRQTLMISIVVITEILYLQKQFAIFTVKQCSI